MATRVFLPTCIKIHQGLQCDLPYSLVHATKNVHGKWGEWGLLSQEVTITNDMNWVRYGHWSDGPVLALGLLDDTIVVRFLPFRTKWKWHFRTRCVNCVLVGTNWPCFATSCLSLNHIFTVNERNKQTNKSPSSTPQILPISPALRLPKFGLESPRWWPWLRACF